MGLVGAGLGMWIGALVGAIRPRRNGNVPDIDVDKGHAAIGAIISGTDTPSIQGQSVPGDSVPECGDIQALPGYAPTGWVSDEGSTDTQLVIPAVLTLAGLGFIFTAMLIASTRRKELIDQ